MFIGIDLGTSSIKMILIDQNQSILASANSSLTVQSPKDGFSEQNPQEWIDSTIECLEALKSKKTKRIFTNYFNRNIRSYAWSYVNR